VPLTDEAARRFRELKILWDRFGDSFLPFQKRDRGLWLIDICIVDVRVSDFQTPKDPIALLVVPGGII
jgi:hypothetical protein